MYKLTREVVLYTYVDVSNFLAELYNSGTVVITLVHLARSVGSAYLNPSGSTPLGSHPVVCRLMKDVFENRPSLPRYNETWDVDTVVEWLAGWPDTGLLTLKHLTLRTNVTGPTFRSKGEIHSQPEGRGCQAVC